MFIHGYEIPLQRDKLQQVCACDSYIIFLRDEEVKVISFPNKQFSVPDCEITVRSVRVRRKASNFVSRDFDFDFIIYSVTSSTTRGNHLAYPS
mmetsp:Transcript_4318/g.15215  ORF Transcript_4318/g.15215 Transcript_4318/m.15215 type:complete len:93 (+) Transcript_4318:817-1095(+)